MTQRVQIQSSHQAGAVHLWKYRMAHNVPSASLAMLSEEELSRGKALANSDHYLRFIQARVFLKRVLAKYVHLHPGEIQFDRSENGKPFLKSSGYRPPVYFNLSYRNKFALAAVVSEPAIGVDVEEVKPIRYFAQFVRQYFSHEERQKILSLPISKRFSMATRFWTMKEALIKATAGGFSFPLTKYNLVSFLKTPIQFPDFDKEHPWCIKSLRVGKNYKGAVAIQSTKIDHFKIFSLNGRSE